MAARSTEAIDVYRYMHDEVRPEDVGEVFDELDDIQAKVDEISKWVEDTLQDLHYNFNKEDEEQAKELLNLRRLGDDLTCLRVKAGSMMYGLVGHVQKLKREQPLRVGR